MNKMLSAQAREEIVHAIEKAEQTTSGEIRIHIDQKGTSDAYNRAKYVFEKLGMTKTSERNGVLIYICFTARQIVILGDQGIYNVVPENFWDDTYQLIARHFKQAEYGKGLSEAVTQIGMKLSQFFPANGQQKNELPNEISEA